MERRRFIKNTAMAGALLSAPMGSMYAANNKIKYQLDKYGGWTGKKFKATGFFRIEKDNRWWIVTPEGNAFLSFGLNHLHSDVFNQDYSRNEWQENLGIDNLNDWSKFSPALRAWFLKTCRDLGVNTAGVHTDLRVINNPEPAIAYMIPVLFVDIPHWKEDIPDENFRDVFSDEYARHCDQLAKRLADPAKDDPYVLGYSMTDCPLFTEEDCRERTDVIGGARRKSRIGWPRRLRNLGAGAAGKKVYVQTMQKIYKESIDDFNDTYSTRFTSFDELASARNWRLQTDLSNGNETRDNVEFLKVVVAKYYQMGRDSIRKYDPNHMFFGDKSNANSDTVDTVLPVTSKYTDLIFYQMYGRYEVQEPGLDRWAKITDKPFINGDSAFTMITEHMPRPYGPVADNLEQRVEWTKEFMYKAFARPDFIGWHYCGIIDATRLIPRKWDRQHSGLLDAYGKPYPLLQKSIQEFTSSMYEIAREG